jgi:hypothetical protein
MRSSDSVPDLDKKPSSQEDDYQLIFKIMAMGCKEPAIAPLELKLKTFLGLKFADAFSGVLHSLCVVNFRFIPS